MNTRKTEKVVNSHLFSKSTLATAVATAVLGTSGMAFGIVDVVGSTLTVTADENYNIGSANTITLTGGIAGTSFNGTLDGNHTTSGVGGDGNIVIAGNLTMNILPSPPTPVIVWLPSTVPLNDVPVIPPVMVIVFALPTLC